MARVVYREGDQPANEGTSCTLAEGKTRQEDAGAADINQVLHRAMQGAIPLAQPLEDLVYADVSVITDFKEAKDRVTRAEQAFMQLPANVRAAYGNDPAVFLDGFSTPEGLAQLEELGVVKVRDPVAELEAAESAAEDRAAARVVARERAARVKAAEVDPPHGWTWPPKASPDK